MEHMRVWNKQIKITKNTLYKTKAHTVLFDLEDGCRQKAMRELLIQELPKF